MTENQTAEPGRLDTDPIAVRSLTKADLDAIVRIDSKSIGRTRRDFYRDKVTAALRDSRIRISLAAEDGGLVVGFLMANLHYGEFGRPEPTAVVDAIGVDPEFRGRKVGKALLRQLLLQLRALGVERVRTEVAWDDFDLLAFFARAGFAPGGFVGLELTLRGQ